MTEDQLRIEQAKLMGWTRLTDDGREGVHPQWARYTEAPLEPLPPIDHNSVAAVRAGLSDDEQVNYLMTLEDQNCATFSIYGEVWHLVNASPHDQLRAVLKVKGVEV